MKHGLKLKQKENTMTLTSILGLIFGLLILGIGIGASIYNLREMMK